jgi:hypothetical protein
MVGAAVVNDDGVVVLWLKCCGLGRRDTGV